MNDLVVRSRPVARVVLIDGRDRVLLFDTRLAYTHVWMTPGGALKPGESFEEAATRELWEETGLAGVSLGPCIWTVRFRFRYKDALYDQQERYFVARISSLDVDAANREKAELTEIEAHHWWSLEDIAGSSASFRPENFSLLLSPILAGDYPEAPLPARVEASAQTALSDEQGSG